MSNGAVIKTSDVKKSDYHCRPVTTIYIGSLHHNPYTCDEAKY